MPDLQMAALGIDSTSEMPMATASKRPKLDAAGWSSIGAPGLDDGRRFPLADGGRLQDVRCIEIAFACISNNEWMRLAVNRKALVVLGVSSFLSCCASASETDGGKFAMDIRLLHEYGRHEALNCASGEIYSVDTTEGQGKEMFSADRGFEDGYYRVEGVVAAGQLGSIGITAGTLIVRKREWVEGEIGSCNSKKPRAGLLLEGTR